MKNLALALLFLAACSPDAGPTASKTEPAPAPSPDPAPQPPRPAVKLIDFSAPSGWEKQDPTNNMRKAQYLVHDRQKQAKDALFVLSTTRAWGPDSMQENLDRWSAQLGGATPKVETFVGQCKVTLVDLTGDYRSDFDPEPIPGARMFVAVVETPDAPWFFKLVGPQETVGGWREEFVTMVKAAHP